MYRRALFAGPYSSYRRTADKEVKPNGSLRLQAPHVVYEVGSAKRRLEFRQQIGCCSTFTRSNGFDIPFQRSRSVLRKEELAAGIWIIVAMIESEDANRAAHKLICNSAI